MKRSRKTLNSIVIINRTEHNAEATLNYGYRFVLMALMMKTMVVMIDACMTYPQDLEPSQPNTGHDHTAPDPLSLTPAVNTQGGETEVPTRPEY